MKVSVIVPAYNAEKFIDKCLNSIIKQTYENIEVIVLNDGSKDGTQEIIEHYEHQDKRIFVVNKENSGTFLTRKLGVEKSTGDSIFHVDADDFLELDAIETLVVKMKSTGANMVISNHYHVIRGRRRKVENKLPVNKTKTELLRSLLNNNIKGYIWGKLYKKELLEKMDYEVTNLLQEDFLANLHIFINRNVNLALVKKPVYNYLVHPQSANSSKNPIFIENVYLFTKMTGEILKSSNYLKELSNEFKLFKCRNWVVYARMGGKLVRDKKFSREFYKENYVSYTKRNLAIYQNLEMIVYKHNFAAGQLLSRSLKKIQQVLY